MWSQTWRIELVSPNSEEAHVKALWNEDGARYIMMQLANIDKDYKRFIRLMAKLMGDEQL